VNRFIKFYITSTRGTFEDGGRGGGGVLRGGEREMGKGKGKSRGWGAAGGGAGACVQCTDFMGLAP
jgi:hypothetical protein